MKLENELSLELIAKLNENEQITMIIETALRFVSTLHKYQQISNKEDYNLYSKLYNDTCNSLAEMKIMLEHAEFIFNKNEIHKHRDLFEKHLLEKISYF
jgi:hypothetical protein